MIEVNIVNVLTIALIAAMTIALINAVKSRGMGKMLPQVSEA